MLRGAGSGTRRAARAATAGHPAQIVESNNIAHQRAALHLQRTGPPRQPDPPLPGPCGTSRRARCWPPVTAADGHGAVPAAVRRLMDPKVVATTAGTSAAQTLQPGKRDKLVAKVPSSAVRRDRSRRAGPDAAAAGPGPPARTPMMWRRPAPAAATYPRRPRPTSW